MRAIVGIADELAYNGGTESSRDPMPFLTIRHVTTYRYRKPVAFGEHRLMFRPRDTSRHKVKAAHLSINPPPASLSIVEDVYGNQVGVARFSTSATELRFESVVNLECGPAKSLDTDVACSGMFPIAYDETERSNLLSSIERRYPDPQDTIRAWARGFLPTDADIGNFDLLVTITRGIQSTLRYRRREEKGIQTPQQTLSLGQGSCRDFAVLMIEAVRSLGFAARFASGYLAAAMDNPAGGATHAWAQVYLPSAGWIDFDPTSGTAGADNLVAVAVVDDPNHALPLHGTHFGTATDHLGMDVHVRVLDGVNDTDTKDN